MNSLPKTEIEDLRRINRKLKKENDRLRQKIREIEEHNLKLHSLAYKRTSDELEAMKNSLEHVSKARSEIDSASSIMRKLRKVKRT